MNTLTRAGRTVVSCVSETTVAQAARLMRERHVGALVVLDSADPPGRPVGILTDRDIVVEVIAVGLDPATLTAGDIMSRELVLLHSDQGLFEAIGLMRRRGVRRLPVVDASGRVVSMFSLGDLLEQVSDELSGVVKALAREREREVRTRR